MKMRIGLAVVLIAMSMMSVASAQSISGSPFIAVHGKAKTEVVPDIFPLDITLKDTSEDAARSQAIIEGHAEGILATVKKMKLPDGDVTVSNLSIAPEYRYDREDQKQVFVGNVYRRQIKLRFRKLTDLAEMVGSLPKAKEVQVNTGTFESSRSDQLRRSLMTKAVQDARATGEVMAKAIGKHLGEVHNVSNQGFNLSYVQGGVEDLPVIMDTPRAVDAPAPIALREGKIELQQNVYIIYTLVD